VLGGGGAFDRTVEKTGDDGAPYEHGKTKGTEDGTDGDENCA